MATPGNKDFSFVTASNPADFKKRSTLKSVRKAVMNDYLEKVRKDPKSKDPRAKSKRRGTSSNDVTPLASPIDVKPPKGLESKYERPRPRTADDVMSIERMLGDTIINPLVKERQNQVHLFKLSEEMNGNPKFRRKLSPYETESVFTPGLRNLEKRLAFSVAYHREQTRGNLGIMHDPRREESPVCPNLDILKINCGVYFGSQAAFQHWVPLTSAEPHSFLASLCISAPYTDLIDHEPGELLSPTTDTWHTAELMDVLPRIIYDQLANSADPNSNANIIAVAYLVVGQLSTPYTSFIPAHQSALRRMISARGGLHRLEPHGVIALNLTLANLEASILRHEPAEQMYIDWLCHYLSTSGNSWSPIVPEGPLYQSQSRMLEIARSSLCKAETLYLINLMHNLNEIILELENLEGNTASTSLPRENPTIRRNNDRIKSIVDCTHEMKPIDPDSDEEKDWIYESVRLAALLFCHAVCRRRPLDYHNACMASPRCVVTPAMIQRAIERTPMKPIWNHLGGVLYWVLMIASTACTDPVNESSPQQRQSPLNTEIPAAHGRDGEHRVNDRGALAQAQAAYGHILSSESPESTPRDPKEYTWAQSNTPDPTYVRANQSFATAKDLYSRYVSRRDVGIPTQASATSPSSTTYSPRSEQPDSPQEKSPIDAKDPRQFTQDNLRSLEGRVSSGATLANQSKKREHPAAEQESKRLRHQPEPDQTASEKRLAKDAYVKRYLTANAMRVSILLRFEHTAVLLASVRSLHRVTQWLEKGR